MSSVEFPPLEASPESLADMVYEAIRERIMDKTLEPGSRVSEVGLARQLGVSKTPVREAMLRLRRIGVLESDGLRGGRVVQPSVAAIRQAYDIREALEVFAVRMLAAGEGRDDIERIREAADRSLERARAGDQAGFREWDAVFHRAISEAAANPRLGELIDDAFTLIVTLRQRDYPDRAASVECGLAHVRIAEAITRGDVEAAETAARNHIRQVEGFVLAGEVPGGDGAGL
jgi:GntR family transcriptional regulator, rspAB operon transcriptional repressor